MPSRPLIYKYPLDLTGVNLNNLVTAEPHTLPAGTNRAIVPNYGAFYSETVIIREVSSGIVLTPVQHYKATQLYQEATESSGKEVCAVIVITDESITSDIEVTYQAVGGEFSYSVKALRDMLDTLDLDERTVVWGDVLGTPSVFPAAPHLHDAGDLYGFEYLVEALESIRSAIIANNEVPVEQLIYQLELRAIAVHVDESAAHFLTKEQVGLGDVENINPLVTNDGATMATTMLSDIENQGTVVYVV